MQNDKEMKMMWIANEFATDGVAVSVAPLGNGLINDTFSFKTENGTAYVLQRINTAIFQDPDLLQDNIRKITDHIRRILVERGESDVDRKVLTPIKTKDGKEYFTDEDGQAWRVTVLIPGSHTEESITPEMAYVTGKAFGEFHTFLSHPEAPVLGETIPDFHNIAFRIQQLKDAAAENKTDRLQWVSDIVAQLLDREDEMLMANKMNAAGELPKRSAHCDTKVNNILFGEDNQILCVIDLDTCMPGFVMSDFGDFMRTAGNTGAEDDEDLTRVGLNMDIFKAFAKGYLEVATFLTPVEKHTLPFGAKLLTYMQTVRFLTDYLNGDAYYKIKYPEHNLVRTRAQLKLLTDMDSKFAEMEAYVDSL